MLLVKKKINVNYIYCSYYNQVVTLCCRCIACHRKYCATSVTVYIVCVRARVYVNIIISEGVSHYITRPIPPLKLNGSFDLEFSRHYLHISMKVGYFPILNKKNIVSLSNIFNISMGYLV